MQLNNKYEKIIENSSVGVIFFLPFLMPVAVVCLLLGVVFLFIRERDKVLNLEPKIFKTAIFGIFFATLLSAIFSIDKLISIGGLIGLILCLSVCILLYYNISISKILKALVLSGIIVTTFGIIQYFTHFNLKLKTSLFSITFATEYGISSTFGNPNKFAQYLIMTLPIGIAFVFQSILEKLKWRIFGIVFVVFSIICLYLTKSLTAWIAFLIMLLIFIIILNWKIGIPITALLIAVVLTNTQKIDLIMSKTSSPGSIQLRLDTWREVVIPAFKSHPLTGCGIATYPKIAKNYKGNYRITKGHAHSLYLNLLCETGIIGLTAFIFMIIIFLWISFTHIRNSPLIYGTTLSIIGCMVLGTSSAIIEFLPMALLLWSIIGIGVTITKNSSKI